MSDYDIASERRLAKEKFSEPRVRQNFIRKVCFILAVQILLTVGGMFLANTQEDVKSWLIDQQYLTLFAAIVLFAITIVLNFCTFVRTVPQLSYVLLVILTAAEIFIVAFISCLYRSETILIAFGITAVLAFVLTVFALQTKIDFTYFSSSFLIVLVIFFLFSLVVVFFPSKTMIYVKASIGAALASMLIIIYVQEMVGGKGRTMVFMPDDAVLAALCFYSELLYLFIEILTLINNN